MKKLLLQTYYRQHIWLLALLWCLMQLLMYYIFGITIVHDSLRYIYEAKNFLLTGDAGALKVSYIVYTIILSTFLSFPVSITGVILLQIILAGIATIAFYNIILYLLSSRLYASLGTLLLILWPDFQFWNFYIHTESIFVSLTIILFYRLITAKDWKAYLQLIALLLVVIFLRPNGFMVALAVISYLVTKRYQQKGFNNFKLIVGFACLGLPLMVLAANYFLEDISSNHTFTGHLLSGDVIQGYNKLQIYDSSVPTLTGSPLKQIIQYAVHDPTSFFQKSILRFFFYWAQVRPYYASWHNLLIVFYIYPIYLLSIIAVQKKLIHEPVIVFIAALGLQLSAMVIVSGVDWDNRFMMPMLPFLFLLGTAGANHLGSRISLR